MEWLFVTSLVGIQFITVTCIMVLGYLASYFHKNDKIIDISWSFSFLAMSLLAPFFGQGYWVRKLLFVVLAFSWSGRLTWKFIKRYTLSSSSGRSSMLKQWYQVNSPLKLATLFLCQGVVIVLLSWPFALIVNNAHPSISAFEWILWIAGLACIVGECMADEQLKHFKNNPQNSSRVCEDGLWGYSRHPNYFFEWLLSVFFFLLAYQAPLGTTALISPLLSWILLTEITGVKMVEQHEVERLGKAYTDYQERVSSFFPWFPKKEG